MTRSEEKQKSRNEDIGKLLSGEVTRQQLSKENSIFGSLNIIECKIVNRHVRIHNDPRRTER